MCILNMFDSIFGWRKASRCKKLIKKLQSRLKHLKNRRCCIITQQRNDVARLLEDGRYEIAFDRVDQIYNDECRVSVYDLLARYCELIRHQFSYIRRTMDCPNNVNEAISSLIFASARCGELPELLRIRKLFKERYGDHFEATALDLLPGNLVNNQIREKLSMETVPDEVKYKLFEDITMTTALRLKPLTLEFTSHQQQQATKGNVDQGFPETVEETTAFVNDFSSNQIWGDCPAYNKGGSNVKPESILDKGTSTNDHTQGIYYLDDMEEHQSPLNNGLNGTVDQRFFLFKSVVPDVVPHVIENRIENSERPGNMMPRKSKKRTNSPEITWPNYHIKASSHRQKKNKFVPTSTENCLFAKQIGDNRMCARAMSLPSLPLAKRVDESSRVKRSFSLPVQPSPPHVHPKLPDYNELVDKFTARKKEYLQNRK